MEQFSLEKWLENPSRKITTRYGDREVRIICTDRKDKRPIVALMIDTNDGSEYITSHSINGWIDDEEKYPDKRDLFFADNELTEFEKELINIVFKYKYWDSSKDKVKQGIKKDSKPLLDLARNEILNDLPKWKKTKKDNPYEPCIIKYTDYTVLETGDYGIRISELFEKLPKEE